MTNADDSSFAALLEYLRDARCFDFTGYKHASLGRRIRKRMRELEIDTYDVYRDYLEVHPEEFALLFNTILINVTGFFRDPDAWEVLRGEYLPTLLEQKPTEEPIRVWSAGCASGEETYTLVMALAEALGVEAFVERVKIYATDVDEQALAEARAATYAEKAIEPVPAELREKYFERTGTGYTIRGDLRRAVIFGRHDLVKDAPISHLDLLVCRNLLMYFNAEVQASVLERFHFALRDGGLLFLGKAEMIRAHGELFRPVNLKSRIFRKVGRPSPRLRGFLLGLRERAGNAGAGQLIDQLRVREAVLDAAPLAQLAIGADGELTFANRTARAMFGIQDAEIGRPFHDLTISYTPVELRSRIDRAQAERKTIVVPDVQWSVQGEPRVFNVHVVPLFADADTVLGVAISLLEVTQFQRLQSDFEEANLELETAYEELHSTNEELETTNEELQSTVEELETTNEELQSSNEELETMNEELQSTNEELEALNGELERRTGELNEVNTYFRSILRSLRAGVVVLDRQLAVRVWNRSAEELWGLRPEEVVGRSLVGQDIGLPVQELRGMMLACLDGKSYRQQVVDAVNRRGRAIQCKVTCTSLLDSGDDDPRGLILLTEQLEDGQSR